MATVVSIINPKGGTGKSTLSTNIARALQLRPHKVILIDGDGQGTISEWSDTQTDEIEFPQVAGVGKPQQLRNHIPIIAPNYDFIVIDGSANTLEMDSSAITVSDIILIPVQPSAPDIWGASDLIDFIRARQEVTNGKPHACFIVSRQQRGTILAREVESALDQYQLPVFNSRTSQRVAYVEAMSRGVTVLEHEPHGKASDEIRAITDELLALVNTLTYVS